MLRRRPVLHGSWCGGFCIALLGCAGPSAPRPSPATSPVASGSTQTSAGAESTAEATPASTPDGSVAIDERYRYVVRVDLTQVRDSPLEEDVKRLFSAIPTWREVIEATQLDPTRELDGLVVASPGRSSRRYVVLAHYGTDTPRAQAIVESFASSRGRGPIAWRPGAPSGLQAEWPGETDVDQTVALLPEGWLVLGPSEEVVRIAELRARPDAQLVPGFPWTRESGITDAGLGLQAAGGQSEENLPAHYPARFEIAVAHDGEDRVSLQWDGRYATAELAAQARERWEARRDEYASNILLRLLGLSRPVSESRFDTEGRNLRFQLELTREELGRLVRFATPTLVGSGRRPEQRRQDR